MAILLMISVWSWQPYILPYQAGWQLLLSVLLLLLFVREFRRYPNQSRCAMLSDDGQWQWLDNQQVCQVTGHSRVTAYVLWLQLKPVLATGEQCYWLWVAKDSVSDSSYRRLCRVVKRIRC